jgi:hypothetical protein
VLRSNNQNIPLYGGARGAHASERGGFQKNEDLELEYYLSGLESNREQQPLTPTTRHFRLLKKCFFVSTGLNKNL